MTGFILLLAPEGLEGGQTVIVFYLESSKGLFQGLCGLFLFKQG